MIKAVIMWPEKWLSGESDPVHSFEFGSKDLMSLVSDVVDTHVALGGAGLSAVQIGVQKSVFVMRTAEDPAKVIINPVLVDTSPDAVTGVEGCLSMPTAHAPVSRHTWVDVRFWDENGVKTERRFEGEEAVTFQHEFDHLCGVMICDYVGPVKRSIMLKQVKKASKKLAEMESMKKAVTLSAKASSIVAETKSADDDYTVLKPKE